FRIIQMAKDFTTKDKVLVHLLDYHDLKGRYPHPVEITQEGMADSIGSKQNTVSYAVRDLVENGLLDEETTRIKGKKHRRKGYFLTGKGVKKAEEVKSKMDNTQVKVEMDGKMKDVMIKDINKYLHTNLSMMEILKDIEDGEFKGAYEERKAERIHQLEHLVEEPDLEPEGLDDIEQWWRGDKKVLFLEGPNGSGKTSLISSYIEEREKDTNLFYMRIQNWHTDRIIWEELASFLTKGGGHRLSSYLEATRNIDEKEALSNFGRDLEYIGSTLIVMDDLNDNAALVDTICDIVKKIDEIEKSKIWVSGTPDTCPEEYGEAPFVETIKMDIKEGEKPLFVNLANHYGIKEKLDVVLDLIVENKLTPEEYLTLAFVSMHLRPVPREEVLKFEETNSNILNNLLKTPLLLRTRDGNLDIHPTVQNTIRSRIPYDIEWALNSFASDYYINIPAKTDLEKAIMLYHLANSDEEKNFADYLSTYGEDIIDSGHARLLIKITEEAKNLKNIEEHEGLVDYWEGEAMRVLGENSQALERYQRVVSNSDDEEIVTNAHNGIAVIMEEEGEFDVALEEYNNAIDEADKMGDKGSLLQGKILLRLGKIWNNRSDYEKATTNLIRAIDVLEKTEDYYLLTSAHFLLARVEKERGNWDDSLSYFKKGLDYWNLIKETHKRINGLHDIGSFYKVIRELDNAEQFLKETMEACEKLGYRSLKASALLTLTECYLEKREFEKAIESAEEVNEILTDLRGREEDRGYTYALLGQAHIQLENYDKAEESLSKAISVYQKIGSSYPLGLVYFSMAKLQEKKGNKEGIANNYRKSLLSLTSSGAQNVIEQVEREMKAVPLTM
ncbi:MAG: tetratricopeptide repeat protein, partial [Thermoplasmatota archaeon]